MLYRLLPLLGLFSSMAWAATTSEKTNPLTMLPMSIAFVVIFYVLIIRPQSKQRKKQAETLTQLKTGDEIILNSGLIGIIEKIDDSLVSLKIAKNTVVTVLKQHIQKIMPKGSYQE